MPLVFNLSHAFEMRSQHRGERLFHLKEKRVALVLAGQHDDPATGSNASNSNDLAHDIDDPVAGQKDPALL